MIDKFGRVMIYVKDVNSVSDFWINKVNFKEVERQEIDSRLISVELSPYDGSDTNIVLFDRKFVEETSDVQYLGAPSLLFSTYDIENTRKEMLENGVNVSEISTIEGIVNFHFPDPEGNYFAIRQITK